MRRVLPSTLDVVIRERVPMGIARLGRELYLVDQHGVVIDEYGPAYADLDLPVIDGLASPPRNGAPLVDERRTALVARLLGDVAGHERLAARLSQIDVRDAHDAVVLLDGDTVMLRLGDRDFAVAAAGLPRRRRGAQGARGGHRHRRPAIRRTDVRAAARRRWRRARARVARRRRRRTDGRAVVARNERYIVGLDIGTSKVCTVVGELVDGGGLDVIGIGLAESKGLKRGVVVNLEAAVDSIKKSVEEAELMAGVEIGSAHLAMSGPHIKGFNSRGRGRRGRQEPRDHPRRRPPRHRRRAGGVAAGRPRGAARAAAGLRRRRAGRHRRAGRA